MIGVGEQRERQALGLTEFAELCLLVGGDADDGVVGAVEGREVVEDGFGCFNLRFEVFGGGEITDQRLGMSETFIAQLHGQRALRGHHKRFVGPQHLLGRLPPRLESRLAEDLRLHHFFKLIQHHAATVTLQDQLHKISRLLLGHRRHRGPVSHPHGEDMRGNQWA